MASATQQEGASRRAEPWLKRWLLHGRPEEPEGLYEDEDNLDQHPKHHQQPWWQVMCLTGVDYFSTLGYQPGIAFLAAGALSPVATLILVLVTLFGALPVYRQVAQESPHGEGSISMLRSLLSWWQGKLVILVLLGFVATAFVITITLSAADAAAHIEENPLLPSFLHERRVGITLLLIALLGLVFLKGFAEAIGIAVVLVIIYLLLNAVVVAVALQRIVLDPSVVAGWQRTLVGAYGHPLGMLGAALLVFPRLALGLSGFETGVVVMPLIKGAPGDDPQRPAGRIKNARRLLLAAAVIMSLYLAASSFVTSVLIPPQEFQPGGRANGRALAYLAHAHLGSAFGTVYDLSTIMILWFAGSSAMAGLLNIVPRYLPRYGMAPEWTVATRPLVLVFTAISFAVTLLFRAEVDAQAGAYATGVLVFLLSGAFAVTLATWRRGARGRATAYGAITLIFLYATAVNVFERPDGVKIAGFFIGAIVVTSLLSRIVRSTELRVTSVHLDSEARRFVEAIAQEGEVRILANEPNERDVLEYFAKEQEEREDHLIPRDAPVLFLEVTISDPSEFAETLRVSGEQVGEYRVLRASSPSVANAIAALLLWIRDATGKTPHVYFNWTEGHPLKHVARFLVFGYGDIPPVTREILRRAERDPERRPAVHVC